jgi:hypothetical protein
MVDRKVVPFDEFYYQLKLMHLFQKHPVVHPQLNGFQAESDDQKVYKIPSAFRG